MKLINKIPDRPTDISTNTPTKQLHKELNNGDNP